MSIPTVPTAVVRLDRERTIRFDMLTLEAVEAEFDQSFFEVIRGLSSPETQRIHWAHLRRFLSACLRAEDPGATPEWVGQQLHLGNVQSVFGPLMRAINAVGEASAAPAEDDSGKPTGSGDGPSTGSTSA